MAGFGNYVKKEMNRILTGDFHRQILEIIPVAIFILSCPDLKFILLNESYFTLIRLQTNKYQSKEELLGKKICEVFPDGAENVIVKMAKECIKLRETVFLPEVELPYLDDEIDYVNYYILPRINAFGKVSQIIGVAQNVTQQKKILEKSKELSEIKDSFFAVAAHELRTPVAVLRLYLDLLKEQKIPAERRDNIIDKAFKQTLLLTRIIQDFLEVSHRKENGDLKTVKFCLTAKLMEIISIFEDIAAQKFDFIPCERDIYIFGDEDRLGQVFFNIMENACKYSPSDSRVTIKMALEGNFVCVYIKDQGMGIPEDEIPFIFEQFYRAKNGRDVKGMGIGLYISRDIVEKHKGRIDVESKIGEGTTFKIILPITE